MSRTLSEMFGSRQRFPLNPELSLADRGTLDADFGVGVQMVSNLFLVIGWCAVWAFALFLNDVVLLTNDSVEFLVLLLSEQLVLLRVRGGQHGLAKAFAVSEDAKLLGEHSLFLSSARKPGYSLERCSWSSECVAPAGGSELRLPISRGWGAREVTKFWTHHSVSFVRELSLLLSK
jgi:hypothetical protein